ncbi:senescence-associated protein-domain-containing protein [Sphaerosporella brunnea]|uniref:Senescence-associated protein-domain-containing protein n=1 Tax=Sphaerosporella brunnea TaxID=1250544 RepID=A0A5J5EUR6_9PEZI|nr:senescence-associated protein-domain-containing protein [Sphaerosporella brunnea]
MTGEPVLFSFPSVSLAPPHSHSAPGLLVLSSSQQPTDFDPSRFDVFLRVQHTPDSAKSSHPTDVLIEAWRELRKVSPREFTLSSEFGEITIIFPELHHLIPQNDARVEIPPEVRCTMTWEAIVREFETEIDRFVSYKKNSYSLLDSPFGGYAAFEKETGIKKYDPSIYSRDEKDSGGRLVLVDEENGDEVGEVGGKQVSSVGVVPGSKDPVEITFPPEGETGPITDVSVFPCSQQCSSTSCTQVFVAALSAQQQIAIFYTSSSSPATATMSASLHSLAVRTADYLRDASRPAYQNSTIVQTAATASRLIVTTSSYIASAMTAGARTFTEKTKPNTTPMTFQPSTHERFQKVHTLSSAAAKFSAATVGRVGELAQNAGAKLAGKEKEHNERGKPRNPNILNKSLIAFSTVADSIDHAGRNLLASGSQAATQVVGHRYGAEAGQVAQSLTGAARNVGLVYIDALGVSRRAVVKGVAKGMVVGKVKGGGEVILPAQQPEGGLPAWGESVTPPPPGYNQAYVTGNSTGGSSALYFSPPPQEKGEKRESASEKFRF